MIASLFLCVTFSMLTADEKHIFEEYKKAFDTYYNDNRVIDFAKHIEKKFDYIFFRLEESISTYGYTIPPNKPSNFTIIYTTKGRSERTIGKVKALMTPRTVVVIPHDTINSGLYGHNTKGFLITFNLKFFLQKNLPKHHLQKMDLFRVKAKPFAYVSHKQGKNLVNIFETLLDERTTNQPNKNEMIALKILELILVCERLFKSAEERDDKELPPIIVQYVDLLQNDFKEHHSIKYYAHKLHIHPNFLNTICKRSLKQSAKQTIDNKLVTEAEHLLTHTNLSAKEIAFELGFESTSHFFRFFRRLTGSSPLNYRKENLNL